MKLSSFIRQSSRGGFSLLLCAGLFSGCKRDDVKVYHVEKDDSTPVVAPVAVPNADSNMMPGQDNSALPQLKWTLPDGWREIAPSQMRIASFTVANPNGEPADVGVIPLPVTGQEIQLVDMWREQMKLPAATNTDETTETVNIGGAQGKLFDIASDALLIDGKFRARILVAMLTSDGTSWFFKMTGEDSFVASQKPAFIQFLKSISFSESTATPFAHGMGMTPATPPAPSEGSGKPTWTIPSDWQQADPGMMLLAKFSIGNGDAKAEVNISQLAGEGGGLLANVNRWRHLQLGLEAVDQSGLEKLVSTFDANGNPASLVDFTGTDSKTGKPARLVGVVVPLAGQTWFYKLMGDEQIVAQQKDAFIKFIQSANYSNAR